MPKGTRGGSGQIPRSGRQAIQLRNAKATTKPVSTKSARSKQGASIVVDPLVAPPGYAPPREETPPSDVELPALQRELVAPFVAIGSRRFEELCRELVRLEFPQVVRANLKRTSGVEQFGVDVEGFDEDSYPEVVLSAKCYAKIRAWDFRPWIDDFLKHLDTHWKDKRVRIFILAVTCAFTDDDMNDAARGLVAELKKKGIKFVPWDTVRMTEILRRDADLVKRFFNDAWAERWWPVDQRSNRSSARGTYLPMRRRPASCCF